MRSLSSQIPLPLPLQPGGGSCSAALYLDIRQLRACGLRICRSGRSHVVDGQARPAEWIKAEAARWRASGKAKVYILRVDRPRSRKGARAP